MARRGVTFDVLGLSDLRVAVDALRDDVQAQLADVLEDTAAAIQARARTYAPRDRGDLARVIRYTGKGLNWRVGLSDERVASRGTKNSAHQHPYVYGIWFELGFVSRHIARHPFMEPAVNQEEPLHNARVDRVLDEAIRKA
jgi:hypothetical protein